MLFPILSWKLGITTNVIKSWYLIWKLHSYSNILTLTQVSCFDKPGEMPRERGEEKRAHKHFFSYENEPSPKLRPIEHVKKERLEEWERSSVLTEVILVPKNMILFPFSSPVSCCVDVLLLPWKLAVVIVSLWISVILPAPKNTMHFTGYFACVPKKKKMYIL